MCQTTVISSTDPDSTNVTGAGDSKTKTHRETKELFEMWLWDPEHAEKALLGCFEQGVPNARPWAAENSNTSRQQLSNHTW